MKEHALSQPKEFGFAILALTLLISVPATAGPVTSDKNLRYIDGNRLLIKGKEISLYAIKAPELGTFCNPKKRKYDCGKIARSSLMDMSAGAKIICHPVTAPHDPGKFKCTAGGYDLSEGMIYTGWAQPLKSAPAYFKKLARQAREKRRGMWRISAQ